MKTLLKEEAVWDGANESVLEYTNSEDAEREAGEEDDECNLMKNGSNE